MAKLLKSTDPGFIDNSISIRNFTTDICNDLLAGKFTEHDFHHLISDLISMTAHIHSPENSDDAIIKVMKTIIDRMHYLCLLDRHELKKYL